MEPKIVGRQVASDGYLTVERLRVRLADGSEAVREVESHGDAVAVLPYDPARRRALVVRLFRPPVLKAAGQSRLEEACAGMIEEGDDPQAAVRREAEEELGVKLGELEPVGRVWTSPGVSTERLSIFLAAYRLADRTGLGGGAAGEHELITPVERPLLELADDSDAGRIEDAKLLMLILALRVRHAELFV